MVPPRGWFSRRRRRILGTIGLSASAGLLGAPGGAAGDADGSFVLEQGDRCVPITPLGGSEPVEDLYDFAYPKERYEGPPGSDGTTFSSEGTTDLQRDRTSILFLYDGPNGLSLVMVHGHLEGDRDQGGTVTFAIDGLPNEGEWLVRDDFYLQNGEQPESNYDRWNLEGDVHTVDWAYQGGRTDGGVFRGLGGNAEIVVEPVFNEAAALADAVEFGPLEGWELLSGDPSDPERFPLRLDRPVTIRQGTCPGGGGDDDQRRDDADRRQRDRGEKGQRNDDSGHESDEGEGQEGEDDEEREENRDRRKHVKQQIKHRKKRTKQQLKHEEKEAQQRIQRERREAKRRRKHLRKQVKHRTD